MYSNEIKSNHLNYHYSIVVDLKEVSLYDGVDVSVIWWTTISNSQLLLHTHTHTISKTCSSGKFRFIFLRPESYCAMQTIAMKPL